MKRLILLTLLVTILARGYSQSNAAPSEHLTYSFPNDAVLQMQKVQIVQSAYTSYFEVNSFTNGYAGLQQTPDSSHGSSHILISSLWDPNTAGGIYSTLRYAAPNTYTGRFGGEGDGWQSINPYNWTLNTWYNVVERSWKSNGQLYIATFINNLGSNMWFHTVTLSIPDPGRYLGSGNDAFLENWDGSNPAWDGRYVRKAYFKDCWVLNTSGSWDKSTSRYFSANANDSVRNGIYNNAFNAGYDNTVNAYFMQHGGNTTPSSAFNGGRTLTLPAQSTQGTAPSLTTGSVSTVSASYAGGKTYVSWTLDGTKSPQLAATVQVLNSAGTVVLSFTDTMPQRRSDTVSGSLSPGAYTAKVFFKDIFNQASNAVTAPFTVAGSYTYWYTFKNVTSGKYLSVKNSSTANLANIVQYAALNSASEWSLKSVNSAIVLVNRNSQKAVDLPGSAQSLGTDPIQYTENDNTNQQWNLVSAGSGKYMIQSNLSNHYVLDDSAGSTVEGTNIILYSPNGSTGSANQQWIVQLVDSTAGASIAAGAVYGRGAELSLPGVLSVYPNPAHDHLIIAGMTGKNMIAIYNSAGQRVYTARSASEKEIVSTVQLMNGVYIIKVTGADGKKQSFEVIKK